MFIALEVSLEAIDHLALVLPRVRAHDAALADQLRRAAQSVAQNLAEGRRRRGADRTYHFRVAAGSADEARTSLEIARRWRYVGADDVAAASAALERVLRLTWPLVR